MQFKSLFTAASLLAMANAVRFNGTHGCGTPEPDAEQLSAHEGFLEKERMALVKGVAQNSTVTVNTYFHVVSKTQDPADGYLTQKMLDDQFTALNKAYNPHGFAFNLIGSDWTVNSTWSVGKDEKDMKVALRKGSYADLNIYFMTELGKDLLGFCTFPKLLHEPGSNTFLRDGCSVLAQTVPGGTEEDYNTGATAIHEVGHWMNLLHTFQGGCLPPGDLVDDTAAEAVPASDDDNSDCPVGRNSCILIPGVDPIHNYMDYAEDSCYTGFTNGQAARMHSSWMEFRAGDA
ncbi:metalloprotease [Xylaria nigripes]|nr:metalloprotease [Xylaria nigripes]